MRHIWKAGTDNEAAITPTYVRRGLAMAGLDGKPGEITEFGPKDGRHERVVDWAPCASAAVSPRFGTDKDPEIQCMALARLLSVLPGWALALCDQIDQLRAELAEVKPKPVDLFREGGCVRQDERGVWLLNHHSKGWASYGVPLKDWDQLFRLYNVRIGAPQQDAAGVFWPVEPTPAAGEG